MSSDPAIVTLVSAKRWDDLVAFLQSRPHEALRKSALNGQTPLHFVIEFSAPLPAIEAVLAVNTTAARTRDRYGRTPLHFAIECLEDSRTDVVKSLLAACPSCASIRGGRAGQLPLERAVCLGAPAAVLIELLDAHTPNECSCTYPPNHDGARAFLECAPLKLQQFFGTALHWAMRSRGAHHSVNLQEVMDAFPDAIHTPDVKGRLPLSLALALNETQEAVQLLFEAYPEAARKSDNKGLYALHHACANAYHIDGRVYTALIGAFHDALMQPDMEGRLPLHHSMGRSMVVVEDLSLIITAHSAALAVQDNEGNTPIDVFLLESAKHIRRYRELGDSRLRQFMAEMAFTRKLRYLGTALLRGIGPAEDELRVADEDSELNLLSLCYAVPRCPVEILRSVAIFNRSLISRPGGDGGRLPLHDESALARDNAGGDGMFVNGLIREHPESLSVRDPVTGKYPLGLMLQSGRSWKTGVRQALMHFPQALNEHSLEEIVLPHAFARLGRECTPNLLYTLFRDRPDCCCNA